MIAIITGDIINSEKSDASEWINILKNQFSKWGESPADWEIYRGDEFQIRIPFNKALKAAILIKALVKSYKDLDVRMAIGIGAESFTGTSVSESNGTAFLNSGRMFEGLKKEKRNLAIVTEDPNINETFDVMLKLALDFMDEWTVVSAEIVAMVLENPNASQREIAEKLNIQQSAVSQRQKRARIDLVIELLDYYTKAIKRIKL